MKLIEKIRDYNDRVEEDFNRLLLGQNFEEFGQPARRVDHGFVHTFRWEEGDATVIFRGTMKQYLRYQKFLELK